MASTLETTYLETIESSDAIVETLETFIDTRSSLSISPSGTKDFFDSCILSIGPNSLKIDPVTPKTGNILFKPDQTLDVRISHEGISYQFQAMHLNFVDSDSTTATSELAHHEITLPTSIQYLDKRSGYRIHLKLAESQPVWISIPPGEQCKATLENISENGACLRLKGNHLALETCGVIDCNIQIDESNPMACKAVIRHYHYSPNADETKAGIEFCQLGFSTEKQLHKLLTRLQQQNIQSDIPIT